MSVHEIPDIVIGRLPVYLRALTHLSLQGSSNTSSSELGRLLGISSAQIRKDLSHFGEFGKQGTGYNIVHLLEELRHILNLEKEWRVAIIGAGFLGHALAHYQGFAHRGFRMCWIFDAEMGRVGEKMNALTVQHISQFSHIAQTEKIEMAIVAVPVESAQEVTNLVVESGVKAILCYAPIHVRVPDGVLVQYSDPVIQMQHMTYYLQQESPLSHVAIY